MTVDASPAVGDGQALSGLVGRRHEVAALSSMLSQAAAGRGSAVVLRGEAGVGKTSLLDTAQSSAPELGLDVLACSGVRAEAQLPFAGLHQLLRPVLTFLPRIPDAQADLLRAALGLDDRLLADLYQVALATLELLSSAAAKTPLLVTADDAHWLDRPTADVLAFVSRRIAAEPIAVIIAVRDGVNDHFDAWRLPDLPIRSLDPASAQALLSRVAPNLAVSARTRLLREAAGNPLALVELSTTKGPAEPPAGPIAIGDLLRQSFTARVADLPSDAQLLLSVAAADSSCSLAQLSQAAGVIADRPVTEAEIQPAIDARLVRLEGDRIAFSHPLVGAAIYQSLTVGDRQCIHQALTHAFPAEDDRHIWHEAAAALGPDDSVATRLQALAERAARRGAGSVSIAALERAAQLVPSDVRRADLILRSAELAADLGRGELALDLAGRVDVGQLGPPGRARRLIITEAVSPGLGAAGATVTELVAAARDAQADGDTSLAASVLWTAASRCWWTSADAPDRSAVVNATRALDLPATDPRRIAILSYTVTREDRPQLRRDLLRAGKDRHDLASLRFVASAAENLGDHALAAELFTAAVRVARQEARLGVISPGCRLCRRGPRSGQRAWTLPKSSSARICASALS